MSARTRMILAIGAAALALAACGGSARPRLQALSGGSPAHVASGAPAAANQLPPGPGALVAWVQRPTVMTATPGGRTLHVLGTRTAFESPQFLWVVARRARWLGVVSAFAGNGRIGWVDRSAVILVRNDWKLRVSLGARQLTVLEHGRVLRRYAVAVGRPSAPTPTGRFSVTDRFRTGEPNGPYGCCILALSAVTPHVVQGWSGGDRIAIHSTPVPASIGLRVSHGCVRVSEDDGRWLIDHVPLGTPTVIRN